MNYLIIFLSVLPVILIGLYYYNKDTLKEPKKLLRKLFFSGILAGILVIIISVIGILLFPSLVLNDEDSYLKIFFYSFIWVALIEELCKFLMIYKISYYHQEFDQMYDIILYSVLVGLGFACLENILYVITSEYGIWLAIFRGITSIPAHACFQTFMGYYLSLSKFHDINNKKKNLWLSIVITVLLHGTYDFLLLSGNIFLACLFLIFLITMFIATILKIKKIVKLDNLNINVCPNCNIKIQDNYCPYCGYKK